MKTLKNWMVTGNDDPYCAPECQNQYIIGDLDGKTIRTSAIQSVDGCVITTQNSEYELGEPEPRYVEWCKANGVHVPTDREPIK